MVSKQAIKANSKLTDFDDFREYIIRNSVRNVPRAFETVRKARDNAISSF